MIMKMKKQQQLKKRLLTIIVIIIIAALAFAYVLPLTAMAAPDTPPPPDFGTDWGLDDSTLPTPWADDDDDTPIPVLYITSTSILLDVGKRTQIQFVMADFPPDTVPRWGTSNTNVVVVNEYGELLAVGPGTAEVEVRAGDLRSSVLVTVRELQAGSVVITIREDIARTGTKSYELAVGDVIRLTSKIEPAGAKVGKFTWVLGNHNVATITPSGQNCEFVATAVGQTLITVMADSLEDSISITIVEAGVPLDQLWEYIRFGVILVVAVVIIAVVVTYFLQKKKREEARRKAAAAKRRREEAERRAREEAEAEAQREIIESRPAHSKGRATMKINGAIVGAGISPPENGTSEPERPLTLDDL